MKKSGKGAKYIKTWNRVVKIGENLQKVMECTHKNGTNLENGMWPKSMRSSLGVKHPFLCEACFV